MKKILLNILTSGLVSASALVPNFAHATTVPEALKCAFCQEEVLATHTFYVGERARALITYKPAVDGHVLIIPERHVERFEQLTSEELAEMGEIIKKVDQAVKNIYGNTGYLLLQKNGKEAGQSVPHVHFHYLPRTEGDGHWLFAIKFLISDYQSPLSPEKMKEITQRLQAEIERNAR